MSQCFLNLGTATFKVNSTKVNKQQWHVMYLFLDFVIYRAFCAVITAHSFQFIYISIRALVVLVILCMFNIGR